MIGQIVSHYRIVDGLGEGGMGSVYVAEDMHLGRRVAIKFPATNVDEHHFRARFLREARAASALNHPNIAAVYDYGERDDGQPFIVMELVNGQTLNSLLEEGKLTLSRAVEVIMDVARALTEAHAHGVIHRDVKPSNVIINERGQIKVLDFGLAKHLNAEALQGGDPDARTLLATRTQSGVVLGTPLYLSPEQAMGAKVDGRSDLFALGAVLYESIAGRPAFSGESMIEIAAQVIHVQPQHPSAFNPRVPPELDRISLKALAKKPEERYQSADELISDLQRLHESLRGLSADHVLTSRIQIAHGTMGTSAMATLSDIFKRPRLSLGLFVSLLVVVVGVFWASRILSRPTPRQPSADAQKWYQLGTNALREGTYYKASKILEQAVAADADFALAHARLAEAWTELDYGDRAKDEIIRAGSLVPNRSLLPPLEALYLQAITNTVSRNYENAVKDNTEIVGVVPATEKAYAYLDLGRAYERNEDIKNATANYLKATQLDPQYAAAFLRLGILNGRSQNLPNAEAAFQRAEQIYGVSSNFEGVAEVRYQRGVLYNNIDRLAEARAQFQQALDMARATSNLSQQIKSQLQLSSVLRTAGDTTAAQQYATEVIELARTNSLENLTTTGLIDLGYSYFLRGDYDETDKHFKQALDYAQRNKGRRNEARALLSLGSLNMQQGKADEAVRYIEQALPFYKGGGYRKETAQALLLLGRANRQKQDYAAALRACEQQLELARQVGDPLQEALSHEGIGVVLMRQERYPEALAHFETSHEIYKQLGNQLAVAHSLLNRATIFWILGRYSEARKIYDDIYQAGARPEGSKALMITSDLLTAEAALSQRHFPEAKTKARSVLATAGSRFVDTTTEAKLVLGLANARSGATREGVQLCKEAVDSIKESENPWLFSQGLLIYAEALLEDRDAENALAMAQRAEKSFASIGQQDSQWRSLLVSALAAQAAGDEGNARQYASRAANLLAALEQKWGAEGYKGYLSRPDMKYYRRQLDELLRTNR